MNGIFRAEVTCALFETPSRRVRQATADGVKHEHNFDSFPSQARLLGPLTINVETEPELFR